MIAARECEHEWEEHRTPFGRKDESTNNEFIHICDLVTRECKTCGKSEYWYQNGFIDEETFKKLNPVQE